MITVFIPFYNLGLGGVQTKIIDLANTLVKSGSYNVIVYLEKNEEFDRCSELDPRIRLIFCPQLFPSLIKRRYYYFLILLIYFYRPNSIFISLEKSTLFLLKAKTLLPFFPGRVIVNVDTYLKKEQIYSSLLIHSLYSTADAVLAPSHAAYADFLGRLKLLSPPVMYLPNWVEVSEKLLKIYPKKEEFLFAGRLVSQKDPLLYVKFIYLLKKKNVVARISIYGEGALKSSMIKFAKKTGVEDLIYFYPTSHQIDQKLKDTRFLLLFSKYEGMPLIGLEAMKYGCVILGKDVAGIQDLIQDNVTGICRKNVSEIVDEYLKIKDDPKRYLTMQKAAYAYLVKNFNQERRKAVILLLTQTQP